MKIAADKWRHFFAGILMGAVLQGCSMWLLRERVITASVISFVLVVAISYGFELFSKFTGRGYYEVMDAVAAALGGVIGMAIVFLYWMV